MFNFIALKFILMIATVVTIVFINIGGCTGGLKLLALLYPIVKKWLGHEISIACFTTQKCFKHKKQSRGHTHRVQKVSPK